MPTLGHTLGFIFSGDTFSIDYAEYDSGKIYVTFSEAPRATDPSSSDDALNPLNYTLTGILPNAISSVATTSDSAILELTPMYALADGYWQISVGSDVANSTLGSTMGLPNSWTFLIGDALTAKTVPNGASNMEAVDILSQFLNPAYAGQENWTKLVESISVTEQSLYDNARKAYDQLHVSSAVGKYLTQRAGDLGQSRPVGVGLTDDLFRQFVIRNANRQLTEEAILAILEVFYGIDSVRASSTSALYQPFAIEDGQELDVLIDEKTSFKVIFKTTDFGIPQQATAIEVASVITRWAAINGSSAVALPYEDPEGGETYVKIYSGGIGLGSSVRVTGGLAQESLRFSTYLEVYTGDPLPTWTVTFDAVTQRVRYTVQGAGLDINPNLQLVQIGDYVNITGTEFNEDNRGSFSILDLSVEYTFEATPQLLMWFEIENPLGVSESSTQTDETSISFYRPEKQTAFAGNTNSVIVADLPDGLDVKLPATSPAVSREVYTATYLHHPTSFDVESFEVLDGEATITTTEPHGLGVGDWVDLEGLTSSNEAAPVIPESSGVSAASVATIWSPTDNLAMDSVMYGFAAKISETQAVTGWGIEVSGSMINLLLDWEDIQVTTVDSLGLRTASYVNYAISPAIAFGVHSRAIKYGTSEESSNGEPGAIVTGGWTATSGIYAASNQVYYYLATSLAQGLSGDSMISARAGHLTAQTDTRTYVFGGMGSSWQKTITNTEYYDPAVSSWTARAAMTQGRFEAAMSTLANGEDYFVTGGRPLAFGPKIDGDTLAVWRLDDSITVPAGSGPEGTVLTGTNVNFVTDATAPQYNANSKDALAFPLSTSVCTGTATANLRAALASRNYTVEGWWRYQGSLPQNAFFAVTATGAGTANNILFGFGPSYSATTKWGIWWDRQSEARVLQESSPTILSTVKREWNHWAVVVSPDTVADEVVVKLYINGEMLQSFSGVKTAYDGANCVVSIGKDPNAGYGATACGAGLGQIRVSNRAFSDKEVWQTFTETTGEVLWNVPSTYSPGVTSFERIGYIHNSTEVYDSSANTWTVGPPMTFARFGHCQVTLPTGEILVVGGLGYNPTQFGTGTVPAPLRDCEIWSPTTNRWRAAARLPVGAGGLMSAELTRDAVYVVGSIDGYAYKYDLSKRIWVRVAQKYQVGETHRLSVNLDDVIVALQGAGITGDTQINSMDLLILNRDVQYQGNIDGTYQITAQTSDTLTVESSCLPAYTVGEEGTVTAWTPVADEDCEIPGPFLMSPREDLFTTKNRTTTTVALMQNHSYTQIELDDVSGWPEEGYLVVNFGQADQAGPIRYFAKLNDQILLIDGAFAFEEDVPVGAYVDELISKAPYNPVSSQDLGVFYLTDSPSGRAAAQAATEGAVAGGITTNITVVYPGDTGLGGEGNPTSGSGKLSDVVEVFSHETDEVDS